MRRAAALMVFAAMYLIAGSAQGQTFSFDTGNNEGWTYRLVNTTTGGTIRSGATVWADNTNYPAVFGDPLGDNRGSAQQIVGGVDYLQPQNGDFLVLQLISPDLATLAAWQSSFSFSAKLAPTDVADPFAPDLFANLAITVDDHDTGTQRSFTTGVATPISYAAWSARDFDFSAAFAAASPPVTNYTIRTVVVNFWISVQPGKVVADPLFFSVDNIVACDSPDIQSCQVFNDELAFRAAAGLVTAYGFEINGLSENVNDLPTSPVLASNFDNHFDIAYTNLNGFNVSNNPGSICNADGVKSLFTHSVGAASNYSMTFSNFGNAGQLATAFGLTVCDFASSISGPATITYDTGTRSGTLLTIPSGQPDFSLNFVGIVLSPADAFSSITLTFDDNLSGFQNFDEVIVPEPALCLSIGTSVVGLAVLARHRRRKVASRHYSVDAVST